MQKIIFVLQTASRTWISELGTEVGLCWQLILTYILEFGRLATRVRRHTVHRPIGLSV